MEHPVNLADATNMKKLCDEESICVFVANLPSTLSDGDLCERLRSALHPFGQISYVKASRDRKGRPFAFVQFIGPVVDFLLTGTVTVEDRVLRFERAKSNFYQKPYSEANDDSSFPNSNGTSSHPAPPHSHPPSRPFPYGTARGQLSRKGRLPAWWQAGANPAPPLLMPDDEAVEYPYLSSHRLLVSNLNGCLITVRQLLRRFQQHGHVLDVEIFRRPPEVGDSMAIVSYGDEDAVTRALESENEQEWLGQRLSCAKATDENTPQIDDAAAMNSDPASSRHSGYYYASPWYLPPALHDSYAYFYQYDRA